MKDLNAILTFETFFGIFKFIHNQLDISTTSTDVRYYFGTENGASFQDVRYALFKMRADPEQIERLKKEILLLEPFGKATNAEEKTEYYVVVLNVYNIAGENHSILLQQKGHMGAPIRSSLQRIDLGINQMTNVVLICPMNITTHEHRVNQTHYHFENLIYTKDWELYCPYYKFERQIDDNRD